MPQCLRFGLPQLQLLTCMDNNHPIFGCDVLCKSCTGSTTDPGFFGANVWARGFLRPSETRDSRTSKGIFHWMLSGDPNEVARRYPINGGYMQGSLCWKTIGLFPGGAVREFFQFANGSFYSLCDCGAGENTCRIQDFVRYFPLDNARCWFFIESGFPPLGPGCTGAFTPDRPIDLKFFAVGFGNTAVIHQGSTEERLFANLCTMNLATKCYGHRVSSSCAISGFDVNGYFNSGYAQFDWMTVTEFTAGFVVYTPEDTLRNKVLDWLASDIALGFSGATHMDQWDSPRRGAGPIQNTNGSIHSFGRSYLASDPLTAPTVATLVGRCRRSGFTVNADYVLLKAGAALSLGLPTFNFTRPFGTINPLVAYPQVGIRLTLNLGIRADVDTFNEANHQITFPWIDEDDRPDPIPITMRNRFNGDFDSFPEIDDGLDVIDWSLDGVKLDPTSRIQWLGEQNFLTDPPSAPIGIDCDVLVLALSPFTVPAAASQFNDDPGKRHKVWSGSIKLRMT